jgi:hypothetical protein
MSINLDNLQVRHALALQTEAAIKSELDAAQIAYDSELERVLAANPELKRLKLQLDQNKAKNDEAKDASKTCRDEAKTFLEQRFIDNLPEGYKQHKSNKVTYNERMLFMAALQSMPSLLKVDDKAVQNLAKLATERSIAGEKKLALPERIEWTLPLKLITIPKPVISDATLKKFKPVDVPVIEEEARPEPVLISPKPKMIDTSVTPKDTTIKVNLVPPTELIDC